MEIIGKLGNNENVAVIGNPIKHSLSPKLHGYFSGMMGHSLSYVAIEAAPDEIREVFNLVKRSMIGANVTSPYKQNAYDFADELTDEARLYKSVNTLFSLSTGKFCGHSTDGMGLYRALDVFGAEPDNKVVLVLGAGGVSGAVLTMLASNNAKDIYLYNRTYDKALKTAEYIQCRCNCKIYTCRCIPDIKFDMIINCTPLGMGSLKEYSPINDFSIVNSDVTVVDLIYSPYETVLLKESKKKNAKIINGLGMLVYQGAYSYEKFMNCSLPDDLIMSAYKYLLKECIY